MANERISSREAFYNKLPELPQRDGTEIKVTKQGTGILTDGYTSIKTPVLVSGYDPDEHDDVGGKWPGPKGRVGTVLHGKSSPASHGDVVVVAPNKELHAK